MIEEWRAYLYPIGFLANLLFTARFLSQWILSEKKGLSHFSLSFWMISLMGSFLLTLHSLIQLQYPICLIQTCNLVLYWRNWQLTKWPKKCLPSLKTVIFLLFFIVVFISSLFIATSYVTLGKIEWMRVPHFLQQKTYSVALGWSLLGFIGTFLFASRFWLHWWRAEKNMTTALNQQFWILSVIGSLCALCYFIKIFDIVNIRILNRN